jgi:polysaccharide biosynthesis/export protein
MNIPEVGKLKAQTRNMRCMPISRINAVQCALFIFAMVSTVHVPAQRQTNISDTNAGAVTASQGPNLPIEKLGPDDLIAISVYDAPELTRSVRVDGTGDIHLPMVQGAIHASGLLPTELENVIANALVRENVLVNPIVTISVMEFHSRPITVVGAVKNPTTFQAVGTVLLLDAITRAGGVTENAGSDILVSHPSPSADSTSKSLTERVPVRALMDETSTGSNLKLEGGEIIRVPEAGQVFVVGNVKHPGAFPITNDSESSVMKMLALSGGLDSFTARTAFIYRVDGASGHKNEIPIRVKDILSRKAPDMALFGSDVLYIPTATGQKASAKAFLVAATVGIAVGTMMVYVLR